MPHRDILAIYHQPDYDITIWQEWLDKINRRVHLVPIDAPEAAEAKIIIAWAPPQGALAKLPHLKGVISLAQGVDHILDDATFPKHLILGRLIDPFMAQSMAAWVTLAILKQHRDDAAYQDAAKKRDWIRLEPKFASDFTVALLGIGAIGGHVAETIAALGFNVLGWSRSQKTLKGVTSLTGTDGFNQCLNKADYVVSILPLTSATRDLFSAATFKKFKKNAYFINCGRGLQVDEGALIDAIDGGHLSGACLDVFRTEPLPPESPLWAHPKITIWPHVSAQTSPITAAEQVMQSILNILDGKPPVNPVNIERGY